MSETHHDPEERFGTPSPATSDIDGAAAAAAMAATAEAPAEKDGSSDEEVDKAAAAAEWEAAAATAKILSSQGSGEATASPSPAGGATLAARVGLLPPSIQVPMVPSQGDAWGGGGGEMWGGSGGDDAWGGGGGGGGGRGDDGWGGGSGVQVKEEKNRLPRVRTPPPAARRSSPPPPARRSSPPPAKGSSYSRGASRVSNDDRDAILSRWGGGRGGEATTPTEKHKASALRSKDSEAAGHKATEAPTDAKATLLPGLMPALTGAIQQPVLPPSGGGGGETWGGSGGDDAWGGGGGGAGGGRTPTRDLLPRVERSVGSCSQKGGTLWSLTPATVSRFPCRRWWRRRCPSQRGEEPAAAGADSASRSTPRLLAASSFHAARLLAAAAAPPAVSRQVQHPSSVSTSNRPIPPLEPPVQLNSLVFFLCSKVLQHLAQVLPVLPNLRILLSLQP
jgi:hypothetical protein